MPTNGKLLITHENGIKTITINRPERRNAVDVETMTALREAMEICLNDDSRVVILTGAGEAFCAGADLQARDEAAIRSYDVTEALRSDTNRMILAMRRASKPIIARIHGPAAGVGFNYALACDIRIASEQARLVQAFVRIGLMPDGGGTYFLPRLVGYGKAFELMATGEPVGADEALRLGLVNRVVPYDQLDSTVRNLAARLADAAPIALRKIKQALNNAEASDLATALEFEAVHQADCFRSRDFLEGVQAFLEKRPPAFQGR